MKLQFQWDAPLPVAWRLDFYPSQLSLLLQSPIPVASKAHPDSTHLPLLLNSLSGATHGAVFGVVLK